MVTVYKMPPKNQFQSGKSFEFIKTLNQNNPQPITTTNFTSDCMFVDLGKESCHGKTSTSVGPKILYDVSIKPIEKLIACTGDFEYFRSNFEIETAKSDRFMTIFAGSR